MANPQDQKTQTDGGGQPTFNCDPLPPAPTPPDYEEPSKCEPRCDCPTPSPTSETCFDTLIKEQNRLVNQAERAKQSKAELEDMLKNANTAKQSYTREKYESFRDSWTKLDDRIVSAIQKVTCNLECWWCVVECHVCPLLYRIREIEALLDGPGPLIGDAHSLRDLQYWHERNVAARRRTYDRINGVLKAWNDPAKSIDAALKANEEILKTIPGKDRVEDVVRVLLEVVPRHLAIAPRPISTNIDQRYIELCGPCDPATPDDCCGPDVGPPTARERLIKTQAYIIDPSQYFPILCCLATERYQPAKEQLEKAQADLDDINNRIDNLTRELATRIEKPLADYRRDIAVEVDCDDYRKKDGGEGSGDNEGAKQTAR